jgi:UDP:flavonoid glycosyltransferase YjiC (YdhE family)
MNISNCFTNYPQQILLFSESISYGHLARSLIIAELLKELNYEIVVACTKSSSGLFVAQGFKTISIEIADPVAIYQRLRQGGMMYQTADLLNYFENDDILIKQIKPSLIVSEFRFTSLQLAEKYGIPSVGITDGTCHPNFVGDGTVPDSFAQSNIIPLWLLDFISQRTIIGEKIRKQTIENISISLREASTIYGLEPLPTFFDYASQGDICLIADHPELISIDSLRPGDIYTGALLWESPEPLPVEISQLDQNKKTVYISLGTQESLPTGFIAMYIENLLNHNLQIIVSRGKRSVDLKISHKNLFIFDFINDSKVFNYVDILVYPGGAMTTYQALSSGVPVIALPAHANQHFYAEAIARQNLGYFFRPSRLKIEELVQATLVLLKNTITRENVKNFQKKLLSFDSREQIISSIKTLLN